MPLTILELKGCLNFLLQAHFYTSAVHHMLFCAGDADAARRLNAIRKHLNLEHCYIARLVEQANKEGGGAS